MHKQSLLGLLNLHTWRSYGPSECHKPLAQKHYVTF